MAVATAEKVVDAPAAKRLRVAAGTIRTEDHVRRRWFVKAPAGATKEDCLYESFWAEIAKNFTRHDIIFLLADLEDWELELRVEKVTAAGAVVSLSKSYTRHPIKQTQTVLNENHCTEYVSGKAWCVRRLSDGHLVITGHAQEAAAMAEWHRRQPKVVS